MAAPCQMEAFWTRELTPLRAYPRVADVRTCGSIAAVELKADGGYLAPVSRELRRRCLDMGVFLRPLGNVLYALPPFCTSETSLRRVVEAMIAAVESHAPAR